MFADVLLVFLLTRLLRGVTVLRISTAYNGRFLLTRLLRGVTHPGT